MYANASQLLDWNDPVVWLGPLIESVGRLRILGHYWQTQKPGPTDALVLEALEVDDQITHLMEQLPEEWRFEVRPPNRTSARAYNGIAHAYHSYRATRYWNALRMMRLFLNLVV